MANYCKSRIATPSSNKLICRYQLGVLLFRLTHIYLKKKNACSCDNQLTCMQHHTITVQITSKMSDKWHNKNKEKILLTLSSVDNIKQLLKDWLIKIKMLLITVFTCF